LSKAAPEIIQKEKDREKELKKKYLALENALKKLGEVSS